VNRRPPGVVVPLHSHPNPETFIPVSGEAEGLVHSADVVRWVPIGPGDVFHVPAGARHAFRNRSREPAVATVVSTARIGRFFREVGTPVGPGAPTRVPRRPSGSSRPPSDTATGPPRRRRTRPWASSSRRPPGEAARDSRGSRRESSSRSAKARRRGRSPRCVRLSTARTRAISSSGENPREKGVCDYAWPVGGDADGPRVRLAEIVAALSLGVDLGFGQPMEHVLRQCLIALRLGERVGMDEEARAAVYYTALLINVGCHSDAHEQAKWFGDDIAVKSLKYDHEFRGLRGAAATLRLVGAGNPPLHRFRVGLEFALSGHREVDDMMAQHARLARALGEQLELPDDVLDALGAAYEHWDGRGWPAGLRGEELPLAARVAQLAEYVEVAHRVGGVEAATSVARRRAGTQFDPALATLLCASADEILGGLDAVGTWTAVIEAEPALAVVLSGERFDAALAAVASFVDLKSPYTLGHSRAVADLAEAAGARLGLADEDVRALRRAGLVHDFGRLGVSNSIWDKRGPLGAGEWERVRMHPYITERMLHQSEALAPLGRIAVQHRERLDGSGYPRGLTGAAISRPARILGAADAYQAMREPRPHRSARPADDAAAELRADVRARRLDPEAVEAVLGAAGHRVPRRREGPAGLTPREVEVLRLLARGLSHRDIAERLVISPKTARNHVEHIYAKIDASSRATASLFAMQHGLLPEAS
jgi:HD-GYP domain-containing protein (c-di-GMP phosphodiesterase class II)